MFLLFLVSSKRKHWHSAVALVLLCLVVNNENLQAHAQSLSPSVAPDPEEHCLDLVNEIDENLDRMRVRLQYVTAQYDKVTSIHAPINKVLNFQLLVKAIAGKPAAIAFGAGRAASKLKKLEFIAKLFPPALKYIQVNRQIFETLDTMAGKLATDFNKIDVYYEKLKGISTKMSIIRLALLAQKEYMEVVLLYLVNARSQAQLIVFGEQDCDCAKGITDAMNEVSFIFFGFEEDQVTVDDDVIRNGDCLEFLNLDFSWLDTTLQVFDDVAYWISTVSGKISEFFDTIMTELYEKLGYTVCCTNGIAQVYDFTSDFTALATCLTDGIFNALISELLEGILAPLTGFGVYFEDFFSCAVAIESSSNSFSGFTNFNSFEGIQSRATNNVCNTTISLAAYTATDVDEITFDDTDFTGTLFASDAIFDWGSTSDEIWDACQQAAEELFSLSDADECCDIFRVCDKDDQIFLYEGADCTQNIAGTLALPAEGGRSYLRAMDDGFDCLPNDEAKSALFKGPLPKGTRVEISSDPDHFSKESNLVITLQRDLEEGEEVCYFEFERNRNDCNFKGGYARTKGSLNGKSSIYSVENPTSDDDSPTGRAWYLGVTDGLKWSTKFSEEDGGLSLGYTSAGPLVGLGCTDRFCDDNVVLKATSSRCSSSGSYETSSFSEEGTNVQHCDPGYYVGGIKCEGSNCDNIKLHCFQSVNCPIVDTIIEQAVVSDLGEGSREQRCPTGSVISGIECSGRYCRTKTIFCKSITYVDASPWWMDDDDDEYCSTLLPLGRECTDPSACESGFCADDKCSSGQDGADCDGDEDCINGRCILNECRAGNLGDTCEKDSDCESGRCDGLNRRQLWQYIGLLGECKEKLPYGSGCNEDSDCESEICAQFICTNGAVGEGCGSNEDCLNGRCVHNQCRAGIIGDVCEFNDDCDSGSCEGLINRKCVARLPLDSSCNEDNDCISGICGADLCSDGEPGRPCGFDSDCLNRRCVLGTCRHGATDDPCEKKSDCDNETCVNFLCRSREVGAVCDSGGDCNNGRCEGLFDRKCEGLVALDGDCNEDSDCESGICGRGRCSDGETGRSCGFDSDCLNSRCVDDICRDGVFDDPCGHNSDCNSDICVTGNCMDGKTGDKCQFNGDCQSGRCDGLLNRNCKELIPVGQTGCNEDQDCAAPGICGRGSCTDGSTGSPCGFDSDCSNERCVEGSCRDGALGDPCEDGERDCDSGRCDWSWSEFKSICKEIQAIGGGCNEDSDCASNICGRGECTNGESDSPCGGDGDCLNRRCVRNLCRAGVTDDPCEKDSDCDSDICVSNYCRSGEPGSPCGDDTDCINSGFCVDRKCSSGTYNDTCDNDEDCHTYTCARNLCQDGKTGDACGHDGDCENGRCVDSKCRAGAVGDPCGDDGDCDNERCVHDVCRAGGTNDPCEKTSDCNSDICYGGSCRSGSYNSPCGEDGHCTTWTCARNKCQNGNTGDLCGHDGDCKNSRCVNDLCRAGNTGDPCGGDSDCNSNICKDSKCYAGTYNQACSDDSECTTWTCARNKCQNGNTGDLCGHDGDCKNSRCVNDLCRAGNTGDPCGGDSDCNSNICKDSKCYAGTYNQACSDDSECTTWTCARNKCQNGNTGDLCGHDGDCKNKRCVNDLCRAGNTGDPCGGDSDCNNRRCVSGLCRAGNTGDPCGGDSDCKSGDCSGFFTRKCK